MFFFNFFLLSSAVPRCGVSACNVCGFCTEGIGGSKMFRCATPAAPKGTAWCQNGRDACGVELKRDDNGALGNFISGIVTGLHPELATKLAVAMDGSSDEPSAKKRKTAAAAAAAATKASGGRV